ncbi:SDR family oxidoreductase [Hirschia litorea]|uniref:SDR family oxidoreductase n=1 Tax=Hirschia litorea TaxID=1199156 RepID=A0ABW2IG42_9PROT
MQKLDNKLCLVTGAAMGIGESICRTFAAEGAHVVVTDVLEEKGLELAQEIGGEFFKLDVSSEQDWLACEDKYPQIDVVVNNAGITGFEETVSAHDPENVSLEEWRRVHQVNLEGTFLGCRYAIRAMKRRGQGSIINMSSRSGLVGIPGAAAYASSKAAIRNHTKSVALYCAQNKWEIRCNSIHPAAILTPIWDAMLGDGADRDSREAAMVASTPLKRFGSVEEVASVALLLASDDVKYMTGTEVNIDGGLLAGSAAAPGAEAE